MDQGGSSRAQPTGTLSRRDSNGLVSAPIAVALIRETMGHTQF